MESYTVVSCQKPLVCVVLFFCASIFGRAIAAGETTADVPTGIHDAATIAIDRVEAHQFTDPQNPARGIKAITATFTPPDGPTAKSVINAYCSARLSEALERDWEIIGFVGEELGAKGKTTQVHSFYVVPSACNNHCNYATRYVMIHLRPRQQYRVAYLLAPRNSAADVSEAIDSIRSVNHDALTVRVWYEFAEPYTKVVRDAGGGDAVDRGRVSR